MVEEAYCCPWCGKSLCYHCHGCGNHVFDDHKPDCKLDPNKAQLALENRDKAAIDDLFKLTSSSSDLLSQIKKLAG